MDQLLGYMKIHYRTLLAVYDEIEEESAKHGKACHIYYPKEAVRITWHLSSNKIVTLQFTCFKDQYLKGLITNFDLLAFKMKNLVKINFLMVTRNYVALLKEFMVVTSRTMANNASNVDL